MTILKLNEAFPNGINGYGIFRKIDELYLTPWFDLDLTDGDLDIEFFSKFGEREVSKLLYAMLVDGVIPEYNLERIARIIYSKYRISWSRLCRTIRLSYDPISNYDMTETEETNDDDSSNSSTHGETNGEGNNNFYGFNSVNPVPDSKNNNTAITNMNAEVVTKKDTKRTLKRSGNIGVTTTQQMIVSEREVWTWNFFNVVFDNVKEVLTIPYYKY